jgi:hypothetical protein
LNDNKELCLQDYENLDINNIDNYIEMVLGKDGSIRIVVLDLKYKLIFANKKEIYLEENKYNVFKFI